MERFDFQSIADDFSSGGNPLRKLLAVSLDLLGARQTGILYGTNETRIKFLPSGMWDRGVMDKFDGRGIIGLILKFFGTYIVSARKLSPVFFYRSLPDGGREEADGIISYVLRNCADYYKKGINVIICPDTTRYVREIGDDDSEYHTIPFYIYNGEKISRPKNHIKVDIRIVKQFNSGNSIYVILPDYGILVINTADSRLLEIRDNRFCHENRLCHRLDLLISLVETASLAYLGRLKGKAGAELLWRKERQLRHAYSRLSENEEKYRDLYENAPIAYFSIDSEGKIFQCNRQASILSGYEREKLAGKPVKYLFENQDLADKNLKIIWHAIKSGKSVKDMELQMTKNDGKNVWVSLSIDGIRGRRNRIIELRVMAVDISRRKNLEKQLVHAQKMEAIGTLARGIAHDFNNILSPVSGYAQMMLMEDREKGKDKEHIGIILDCARHAKDLVNKILTFSRQKEQRLSLVDAKETLESSMVLVRSFLPSSIKIFSHVDENCGFLMADPVQIHQVIMNLVTNAFHAMEEKGGTLEVSMSRVQIPSRNMEGIKPGEYICLKISDTGTGIDPKVMPNIFEPYFTTKKGGKGSGIGLSVVHGIIQTHGGQIRVESTRGEGACFLVYLPVCSGKIQSSDAMPLAGKVETGSEHVLLVDDDKKVAVMHSRLLEYMGYRVSFFTRSPDALEAYESDPASFDVLITDLTMPDMDGLELARKIGQINPDLPVILCTGLGDSIENSQDGLVRIKEFLSKPVEAATLSGALKKALKPG